MALLDLGNKIIAKPNNSLSTQGGLKVLVVLLLILLIVTLSFVRAGAWLVLPFAGLELVAFFYAFYVIYLHADDYESITIDDENVLVEKRNNKQFTVTVFKRYWAQVSLRNTGLGEGVYAKSALFISSHGNEVEFGKGLVSDAQRPELAQQLKQKIKNINQ